MKGFVVTVFLLLFLVPNKSVAYDDGIRIGWEYGQRRLVNSGTYPRIKKLNDGRLALVYDAGGKLYIRFSATANMVWGTAVEVARDNSGTYNYTNSELIELQNGTLIYAWNARPRTEGVNSYKIMIKKSENGGSSWTGEQILYQGGNTFGNGCWEPALLQLPSGELQVYFANEAPYTASNEQEISLLRSFDNGTTWNESKKISFRAGSRDGMPVPVCLQNGKGIVMAIEDNGINGTFKPVIVYSEINNNWQNYVGGSSLNRWHALRTDYQLASGIYAGAPYIIQLNTGETVLSVQSGEGRNPENSHTKANMQVYTGSDEAKNFSLKSTPFPALPPDASALWSSLCQISDTSIAAVSSVNGITGQNGVWTSVGRIMHPAEINKKTNAGWGNYTSVYIGSLSPASMKMKALWDSDSIYFRFEVKDAIQTIAPDGSAVWDTDGVEVYLDPRNRNSLYSDIFKVAVNISGQSQCMQTINNQWVDNPVNADVKIERGDNNYTILLTLPWSGIGGAWSRTNSFGIHIKLHNIDNGSITHEDLSGGNPDKPQTWMKTTLMQTTGIKGVANEGPAVNISGIKGGVKIDCEALPHNAKVSIFSMPGRKICSGLLTGKNSFFALSSGAYIVRINDINFQRTGKVVVM